MAHINFNPATEKALKTPVTRQVVFQVAGLHRRPKDEIESLREFLAARINAMTPRGSAVTVAFRVTGQADSFSYGPQFYGGDWDQGTRDAVWDGFREAVAEARGLKWPI